MSNVSLELDCGDFVGILGPGSAGKTTLLKLAAGLEIPDSGTVTYQGQSLSAMSRAEVVLYRQREVGCIWGTRHFYPGLSVLENVALPLLLGGRVHQNAEHSARETLEAVHADRCVNARPAELSAGELQRVTIAQALITKPRVLLADEPVSNLDFYEQDSLLALFQSLARDAKMAVLITDTDATALMRARPILYLSEGRLLTERSHKMGELIELPGNKLEEGGTSDA